MMFRSKQLVSSVFMAGFLVTNLAMQAQALPVIMPDTIKDLTILKTLQPRLAMKNTEVKNGFTYYNLTVTNWQKFSPSLFAAAPDLPPCGLNNNSSRTWVEIYNGETNARIYGFCAFSNPEDMTKMWFAVPQGSPAPKSVYVVLHDRRANRNYRSNTIPIALNEDCIAFDPANTAVELVNGRWTIVENGNHLMFNFEGDRNNAVRSLQTIKHYGMNKSCFVGRPQPSFQYMLVNNGSPVGPTIGEDCVPFNPVTTKVSYIGNRWKIVDGDHWMFDFADNRAEAEQSLAVMQKYGFDKSCYVGRPNAKFSYLRR
jgi:hypothetical protein